ncbi:hypothetical protein N7519_005482 [Penicillium mononematosum]|uniref:uncharacterized protein n=1 Tax=Penicillium mononematosum TaxID=268346 RepID=UPI002549379E|nr:uncharacterized protein N7519_005482 [Penicillium mononematosum]KAJ6184181.1 hypothetical protein N7519_005482 [Penicillium mononematosum]
MPKKIAHKRKSSSKKSTLYEKKKLKLIASAVNHITAESPNHELLYLYYRVEVGTYLLPASNFIGNERPSEAEFMVKIARQSADKSKNPFLVARCEFWMGRVEFLRGNMHKAHEHFVKANLCAMDPSEGVECQDLSFYLDVTRHGISEHTRAARLRAHEDAILAHAKFDKTANNSVSTEVKRKRPLRTWKGALVKLQLPVIKQRPLTKVIKAQCRVPIQQKVDKNHLEQGIENQKSSNNQVLGKVLAEELGYESWGNSGDDTDDTDTDTDTENESDDDSSGGPTDGTGAIKDENTKNENATNPPGAPSKTQQSKPSTDTTTAPAKLPTEQSAYRMQLVAARARYRQECFQMGLTTRLNPEPYERPKEPFVFGVPHEPTKQTQFRAGFFKIGLEKRSRPMTIFPKQAGEITISPEEWKSIEQDARQKIVTYDYLRRERYELLKVAEEM